ncbi:hypothetical protein SAMN05216188_102499 [Lentzea xinjiangensis]|uniref:Uncharacterized protein n=1 Tax=Lentzea xinjiangensis TaxID=402600 RepID=A0A1H9ECQ2_9PSEU|nr:hypothetical protein [Lentzea xinjiangensis]SEQ23490.1 hypothetical protein SAMN05216188_102499 [Lentzea xinjiangensis]
MTEQSTAGKTGKAGRRLLFRVVLSMAVGAGLVLGWTWAYESGFLKSWLDSTSMSTFLLLVLIGLPLALVSSLVLAGPVLWAFGVRPVWPIILLGPVLLGLGLYLKVHEPILGWFANRHHAEAVLAAVAYGLVGLVTFRRS